MYKKVRGTCKVVVLLNKTYCFLDILAAVASLNLQVNENALIAKHRIKLQFSKFDLGFAFTVILPATVEKKF